MFPLVLIFIVVPLLELYVIIEIGQLIGALPTIAILLGDSLLGAVLLRSQGRTAWRRFNAALAERRVPAGEIFDGVLILFGAALLLTPGFITDALGLLLLVPPSRALIRRSFAAAVRRRVARGGRAVFWSYERYGEPTTPGHEYESTAQEVHDPPRQLPPETGM